MLPIPLLVWRDKDPFLLVRAIKGKWINLLARILTVEPEGGGRASLGCDSLLMSHCGITDTNCPEGEQSLFQVGIHLSVATHYLR